MSWASVLLSAVCLDETCTRETTCACVCLRTQAAMPILPLWMMDFIQGFIGILAINEGNTDDLTKVFQRQAALIRSQIISLFFLDSNPDPISSQVKPRSSLVMCTEPFALLLLSVVRINVECKSPRRAGFNTQLQLLDTAAQPPPGKVGTFLLVASIVGAFACAARTSCHCFCRSQEEG